MNRQESAVLTDQDGYTYVAYLTGAALGVIALVYGSLGLLWVGNAILFMTVIYIAVTRQTKEALSAMVLFPGGAVAVFVSVLLIEFVWSPPDLRQYSVLVVGLIEFILMTIYVIPAMKK